MTRCYLDEVEAGRWYQMRLKWNRELLCGEPKNAFLPFPLTKTVAVGGADLCPGKCFAI